MGIPSRDGDQWAPSSHYPFAEPLMNTIISWKERLLTCMSDPLIFAAAAQGTPLDYWALKVRRSYVWSHDSNSCRDSTWHPPALHREHPQRGCVREACLLVQGLWPVGQICSGPVEVSQGKEAVDTVIVLSLCHIPAHCYLPKRNYTPDWDPGFYSFH